MTRRTYDSAKEAEQRRQRLARRAEEGVLCALDGCNRPLANSGVCEMHKLRMQRTGSYELKPAVTVAERFWKKVDVGEPDQCWEWTKTFNNHGYGKFLFASSPAVKLLAHRFAYELATGEDIRGKVLRHSCDNPRCCNPAHLTPGTQAENMRDCAAKGRWANQYTRGASA